MIFTAEDIKKADKKAWDMLDGWNHEYCPKLSDYAFFYYNGKVVMDPAIESYLVRLIGFGD